MILREHRARVQNKVSARRTALQLCLWSLAPVVMLSLSLDPCFSQHLDSRTRARTTGSMMPAAVPGSSASKLSGQVRFSKKSDAESSVQLLETIINRIMNIPQVAQAVQLNKNTGSQLMAQNVKQPSAPAGQRQGVDYSLAIRPKETGKGFASATPSLQMIAQAPPSASAGDSFNSAQGGLQLKPGGYAQQSPDGFDSPGAAAENWKGGALTRLPIAYRNDVLASANTNASGNLSSNLSAEKPGFWDREGAPAKDSANLRGGYSMRASPPTVGRASAVAGASAGGGMFADSDSMNEMQELRGKGLPSYEEAKKQSPDLAASINRFYRATKRIDELQNASPEKLQKQMRDATASAPGADKARYYNAPREMQILDERPVVRDFREQDSGAQAGIKAKAEVQAAGAPAPSRRAKASFKAEPEKSDSRLNKLALLPPNVATGTTLPLVSLGNSEAQVTQFLNRIGKLQEQKIKNWEVYSWYKKDGNGAISLQLFFKHGLLDAIRIYDPTLVAADFGAAPGDSLEAVKDRFGEPAFLLPEPGSSTSGKNYIYPISQVAFQLARQGGDSPQVVSVLIFSVR